MPHYPVAPCRVVETLESRLFLSAGQLDPDFGNHGELVLSPPLGFQEYVDAAIAQPDGKLLVLAQIWRNQFEIRRYTQDHRLDRSFGDKGSVHGLFYDDVFYRGESLGIALQPDGGILHLYQQSSLNGALASTKLERFLSNGQLDGSFGENGAVTLWEGERGKPRWVAAFVASPDGGSIVGGRQAFSQASYIVAQRRRADGTIDRSFGRDGTARMKLPAGVRFALDTMLRQPDGKIVCIGSDNPDDPARSSRVILARFSPDGSVDRTFGKGGLSKAIIRADRRRAASLGDAVLQPDGGIIVSATALRSSALLMRFNANGSVDRRFGGDGRSILWRDEAIDERTSIRLAMRPDGKAVFAFETPGRDAYDQILAGRVNPGGEMDRTFGRRGIHLAGSAGIGTSVAVFAQSNGKTLLVGVRDALNSADIVLSRYQGDPLIIAPWRS